MDLYRFIRDVFAVSVSQSLLIVFIPGPWDFGAYNGRLYKQDDRIKKRIGAWCAKDKKKGHWLQVDLGKIKFVTAVATQGETDRALPGFHAGPLSYTSWTGIWRCFLWGERKQNPWSQATYGTRVKLSPGHFEWKCALLLLPHRCSP